MPAWLHCFRHSFGHYLSRSLPGPMVREQMGHAGLSTTSRYAQFTDNEKIDLCNTVRLSGYLCDSLCLRAPLFSTLPNMFDVKENDP